MNKSVMARLNILMDGFIKSLTSIFFNNKIFDYIRNKYDTGLEQTEQQFNINFMRDEDTLEMLRDYVQGNVGNTLEDINQGLRQEIQRAVLDRVDIKELRRRLMEKFEDKKYLNRLKMVIRTEGNRAGNMATMDSARQSGLELYKYLDNPLDDRTSDICWKEMKKYGTKEKAIPLEDEFVIEHKGEQYIADAPPFHPNCFLSGTKIITNYGVKNIEDIQVGDYVMTKYNRYKEVTSTMINTTTEYFEITTSKGKLQVTGEHPIMTANGWKAAKDLNKSDWVLYIK